ncbi:thioredoxin family protein [Mucilaginibacter sp. FT3.2]|uniref:thioredoxin family protein n=1 Tax=Mucilaginibacter sp. FT3.2 TaxID=2723090 RepID=UPI00161B447C|nr:thioredoxin family protein [Mucilaginibacter sp. FT3.2]MBB6232386.1 hypothetical protein [Mucilaginibacter sp. FT3.2]
MNFTAYQLLFQEIISDPNPPAPYNNPDYLNYTRLNWSRQQRWLKTGVLNDELKATIANITKMQYWTVITEPWCGDAAHTLPLLHRLSEINPLIEVDYKLRDTGPFLIDKYLTNGTKSIPKLIITDNENNELAVWGPRPVECQLLYMRLLEEHVEMEQKKIALQQWYNQDKGKSFQIELLSILLAI